MPILHFINSSFYQLGYCSKIVLSISIAKFDGTIIIVVQNSYSL